jgi:hypothetical protein
LVVQLHFFYIGSLCGNKTLINILNNT